MAWIHKMYFHLIRSISKLITSISYFLSFFFKATKYICGGLLFDSFGTLQSPSYPSNYPDNADCLWQIQVKDNFRIMLTFGSIQ